MVRIGDKFEEQGITIHIKEVLPYFNPVGKRMLMIGYRIQDGKFVSTIAHFFMGAKTDIRKEIKKVAEYYLENKKVIQGSPISL